MSNFNRVLLMGHLTRDPERRATDKGLIVCSFGVASNRKYKDKDEVLFIDVVAFAKTAETILAHLRKGSPIFLEGHLRLETWQDKQTNQPKSRISVVLENFQFVGSNEKSPDRPPPSAKATQPPPASKAAGEEEDDVPF